MSNEELNEATEVIINALMNSELNNYAKLELMLNLRRFLADYDKNVSILRKELKEGDRKWKI